MNFDESYKNVNKTSAIKDFKKWWGNNGYKVMRVILFPIWICAWAYEKIKDYNWKNTTFSAARAKEFCDWYLPRHINKTENGYYYYNNGYGFGKARRRKDKVFVSKYKYDLLQYIKNEYEIEGYTKRVIDTFEFCECEVEFIKGE